MESAVVENAAPSWRAFYQTTDGKVTWDVDANLVSLSESMACPVSVITPDSMLAVRQFAEAKRTQKLGGVRYGTDASLWPARWHAIVTLLQYEIEREEAAAQKAIHARRIS